MDGLGKGYVRCFWRFFVFFDVVVACLWLVWVLVIRNGVGFDVGSSGGFSCLRATYGNSRIKGVVDVKLKTIWPFRLSCCV